MMHFQLGNSWPKGRGVFSCLQNTPFKTTSLGIFYFTLWHKVKRLFALITIFAVLFSMLKGLL